MVKRAIEWLYDDEVTLITYTDMNPEPDTGIIKTVPVKSGPYLCRLSYKTLPVAGKNDGLATLDQTVTLFISPDIAISAGTDMDISHQGRILQFTAAGVPALYDSHQEIPLQHRGKYHG
nr:MAG TPA: head closure knob [Caudoviricetes sp.]